MGVIIRCSLIIATFLGVEALDKPKNEFAFSKEDQFGNPDEFWPITSSLHGPAAPPSSITAVLYDAVLTGGEADLNAVEFDGTSASYMKITNTGDLDGVDAFCWVFNLYPYSARTATILEYTGTVGNGVKLSQIGTSLNVKLYDQSGALRGEYSRDILTMNSWNFVGFSYNNVWGHIDIIQGDTLDSYDISVTDLPVNALGDVTIGNSVDGSSPFHGKISCIQFYQKALFKKALRNPPSYCTLAQWASSSLPDWTKNFVPTTTTATTMIIATTPTTTTPTWTVTTQSTTTTRAVNMIRGYQETLSNSCYYFSLKATNRDLATEDIILEKQGTSQDDCAKLCTSNYQCVIYVTNDNGDCKLSDTATPTLTTPPMASSKVYVMVRVDKRPYIYGL